MSKNLSQKEVPGYSLDQALRVPRAIAENFAYEATKPLQVAKALGMQPNSGPFRTLCGAAAAYGITKGGPRAAEIALEPLGLRVVRPTEDGDDLRAQREALLKPRVVGQFLRKYNDAPLPNEDIAQNVLLEMGVPQKKVADALSLILESAEKLGLAIDINGKKHVDLDSADTAPFEEGSESTNLQEAEVGAKETEGDTQEEGPETREEKLEVKAGDKLEYEANERRVFIAHGKNKAFIDSIKKLLGFGELEAVVSVERTSVSQPLPDKVMKDMRSCGAAIIHVEDELRLVDQKAEEQVVLNSNVLIEIGAAMALYGRRFILLVKEGIELPSDLRGLFEVRYAGGSLDGDVTIKLLEAINDIKNYPLPARYSGEEDASAD